jgi:hypothetical protein
MYRVSVCWAEGGSSGERNGEVGFSAAPKSTGTAKKNKRETGSFSNQWESHTCLDERIENRWSRGNT